MTYTSVDWAMIGIGALGVGFAAAEMGSVEESPDRAATPATPPAAPPGPPGVPGVPPLPPLPPNPLPMCTPPNPLLPPICQPGMSEDYQNPILKAYTVTTPDHQAWLDSGMGQMGDLVLIK